MSSFILNLKGQVVSGKFKGNRLLSCAFSFVYGKDSWKPVATSGESTNLRSGQTQLSSRSWGKKPSFVWNFPLEITLSSTSPSGWPKICLNVSDCSVRGKAPVIGYGWCHVPMTSGKHEVKIPMFKPRPSSIIQKILSYLQKRPIEFNQSEFVTGNEGRSVTKVDYTGYVKVIFNVSLMNFKFS